jgi:hypothetical protein
VKKPRQKSPTEAEWLNRLKAATVQQGLIMGVEPEPWLRQLCIDLLRASHGTSPEFEAAALAWLCEAPPTLTVGFFLPWRAGLQAVGREKARPHKKEIFWVI